MELYEARVRVGDPYFGFGRVPRGHIGSMDPPVTFTEIVQMSHALEKRVVRADVVGDELIIWSNTRGHAPLYHPEFGPCCQKVVPPRAIQEWLAQNSDLSIEVVQPPDQVPYYQVEWQDGETQVIPVTAHAHLGFFSFLRFVLSSRGLVRDGHF